MDLNAALGPVRPFLQLIGKVIIVAGLAKFFGVNVPISGGGLELAVAGWLMQSI